MVGGQRPAEIHCDAFAYEYAQLSPTFRDTLSDTRGWALQRLGEPLTLRLLARYAGVSQRTLMRRFAEETGTTPMQWLLNARLGRARELLETTEHPIDHIARDCGLGTAANSAYTSAAPSAPPPPPTAAP
ncbi:helix-turn-helix domain-containing protein [Nocardia miyunensis]|uniref:helix-turn-helix domain-containing protein n=1 Tax=Nocardia miyunensis TaxID=282684 RepID=UPI000A4440DA|nr:helix-turn-helix domain-containing protein [Nocardia miyunensis]